MNQQRACGDGQKKQVDYIFNHEKQIRQAVFERRNDSGGHTGGGGTGHSYVSDPTALHAIRLASELNFVQLGEGEKVWHPEKWLEVIDATYEWCAGDEIKSAIIERRYRRHDYYVTVCNDLHISQTTHSVLLTEIRNHAMMEAAYRQLVRP